MLRFPITQLLTPRSGPSLVLGMQTFSSSSSRFFSSSLSSSSRLFSTSSSTTNHSKLSTPGTGISENLKPMESVALPLQSHARAMTPSVDVSLSVDQGVPVATNITSWSEFLGWIGDMSQTRQARGAFVLVSCVAALAAIVSSCVRIARAHRRRDARAFSRQ